MENPYAIAIEILVPVLTFLLGDWAALSRDRRKEFNALTNEIFFKLKSQVSAKEIGKVEINADVIEPYLPFYKRKDFRHCVDLYDNAHANNGKYFPETGQVIRNEEATNYMVNCAENLLNYLRPR